MTNMELVYQITIILPLLAAYCHYADALIGLRPPKKAPPKDKKENQTRPPPASPRPTQLHSPYDNPAIVHNFTNTEDSDDHVHHESWYSSPCHTMPLLRCSYKLLSQSLQNDSSICKQVQQFSQCSKSTLRDSGRRDFIIGVGIADEFTKTIYSKHSFHLDLSKAKQLLHKFFSNFLSAQFSQCSKSTLRDSGRRDFIIGVGIADDFTKTIYSKHSCHDNASFSIPDHKRHHRAKRLGSHCCVDAIMNCAVEVFLKMTHNRQHRCPLVDFYDLCLQEANDTCKLDTLRTLSPVFTGQLKRKCKTATVHRKTPGLSR